MAIQSYAAGPITLECQALVIKWKSSDENRVGIENFSMSMQSQENRSHIFIFGETRIQLDINEMVEAPSASKGKTLDQKIEIEKTHVRAEKIIREGKLMEIHIMNVDIPTGKLRLDTWVSPNRRLIAEGRCR